MVLIGGCLASLAYGLIGAGVLLLALTVLGVRMAGVAMKRERNQ